MAFVRLFMFALALIVTLNQNAEGYKEIGVNYGLLGDNLPPPAEVVGMLKEREFGHVRIFSPNADVLNALSGSGIKVTMGVANEDLPWLSASQDAVDLWFSNNVRPYIGRVEFEFITVGNEVIPGNLGQFVAPVMRFLQNVIARNGLRIKVSTVVFGETLANSYPPSAAVFRGDAMAQIVPVVKFLSETGSSLLVNAYPYFAYAANPKDIRLDYAMFSASGPVVQDGNIGYRNMLDAMIDAFYWAMEKEGVTNVPVVVSETGWPSAGNGELTTPKLAETYNSNFIRYILSVTGTPKRPDFRINGFIFAMFNENKKPEGVEQNWGLFYPNKQPVYNVVY